VIVAGPGHLLLALVPKPDHATIKLLEVIAGAVLIAVGLLLWRFRVALGKKRLPEVKSTGRAAWLLGLTITSFELPTAFPYFGALAAIVGSGLGLGHQLILLLLYNVCFALPLAGIVVTLEFGGENAELYLVRSRDYLQRHWPMLLATVALVAGAITITLGLTYTSKIVHRTIRATEHRF
jgi:cytochrome c biogenesis protein CcdA